MFLKKKENIVIDNNKKSIIDCFTFFNELDILEIRLNELYDVVDRFVIVEATLTHSGNSKPLYFNNNLDRFQKFLNKITYLVVEDLPVIDGWNSADDIWRRERMQRDAIMRALTECADDDIIIISDIDEIPRAEKVKEYDFENMPFACFEQDVSYYYLNMMRDDKFHHCKILPYGHLKTISPCQARYTDCEIIKDGGWHFSFVGDIPHIIQKIESYAHQEYNRDDVKNPEKIQNLINQKKDIFSRGDNLEIVSISNRFPKYVTDNIDDFVKRGLIKLPLYDCFLFHNEFELLTLRLNELNDTVDYFVIVESTKTLSGKSKPLYFKENKDKYKDFLHKIIYIAVDDFPEIEDKWTLEKHQRNAIMRALTKCNDNDIIMISDVDEIPNKKAIKKYNSKMGIVSLEQNLYYYYYNCIANSKWGKFKILPYSFLKDITPELLRHIQTDVIEDGGWHFSHLADTEGIIKKIESCSQEFDSKDYQDRETISKKIAKGKDIYGRNDIEFSFISTEEGLPEYLLANKEKFNHFFRYGGSSFIDFKGEIKEYLLKKFPNKETTILDVGPGEGFYWHVLKDSYHNLDCVEIYGPNIIGNKLEEKYRKTFHSDVCDFKFDHYDVIIIGDVLEHLSVEKAQRLIERLYDKCDEIVVSVPWLFNQEPIYGNEYEKHLQPDLTPDIMKDRYPQIQPLITNQVVGVYIKNKIFTPYIIEQNKKSIKVTASISTKDRYYTTLPMCLSAIANQTYKPEKILLFDDGEQKDLREDPIYSNLFSLLFIKGIELQVVFGERKGQIRNHQKTLEIADTEWIWRLDDDNIPEPDVLEKLISCIDDKVGAIAGCVLDPKNKIESVPIDIPNNTIDTIENMPNIQWFSDKGIRKVEHLYSSFLFRKEAAKHGYCLNLSIAGHREETIFTHEMFLNGWDLLVNYDAITWHLRFSEGGIRSFQDENLWHHDDAIFNQKRIFWKKPLEDLFPVVLDSGIGDHFAFLQILPDIINKHGKINLFCCFPDLFEEYKDKVNLLSIMEAKAATQNIEDHNIYKWMWDNNWKEHITEAFRKIYKL